MSFRLDYEKRLRTLTPRHDERAGVPQWYRSLPLSVTPAPVPAMPSLFQLSFAWWACGFASCFALHMFGWIP